MALAGLKRWLGGLADVRREELSRLLPLTLAYGLVMASLYVLKPARNALFLEGPGIGKLPYVLLLVALFGGLAATVFTRFTALVRLDRLILGTFLFLMACLGGFWLLLPQGWLWSYYLFYVWVNLCSLMAPSLLWLLANAVFNAREARRLFGLINSAGIVGVVLGSAFTGWIVRITGTENLLLICIALLGACLGLLSCVRPGETRPRRKRESATGALGLIARSDILRLLGGMAALAAVVAAVVDVQFNWIVDQTFLSKDAKTAFFGQFFAYLNIFAFFFQLVLAPRILRSLGVNSALVFLPLSMAMGSLAVLFAPGLVAAILVKVGDGGFRHSIHKSATEILFLPVPAQVKQRTKVLLDTTVDNVATGLGALLVLLLTGLGVAYHHLSLLALALIVVWLGLIVRGRGAYVDAFRRALERREIDVGEYTVDITEAATIDNLVASLGSPNERWVGDTLDMLASVRTRQLVEPVRGLLRHRSAEVRQKALRVLQNQEEPIPPAEVEARLQDHDLEVRIEALYYLCRHGESERLERLQQALKNPDQKIRTAAVGCIAEYGTTEENQLIDEAFIRELIVQREENVDERVQAAKVLGRLDQPGQRPYLRELMQQLMNDPRPVVVQQIIASVGKLGDPEHVPWLLDKLADRRYRLLARQALAAYGIEVLEMLSARLLDESADLVSRNNVVRALGEIVYQETVDLLLERLEHVDPSLQYPLVKALTKLRNKSTELRFDRGRIDAALQEAIRSYYEIFQVLRLYKGAGQSPAVNLLQKALREKQEQNLKRITRLLGLQYPLRDMYNAYLGLVGGEPVARASAIEFLDNTLERPHRENLLPFLEPDSVEDTIQHGEELFGTRLRDRREALEYLLCSRDAWLRACAVYSAEEIAPAAQVELVQALQNDVHPVVRETVAMVLRRAAH